MKTKKKRGREKQAESEGKLLETTKRRIDEGKHEYETSKTGLPVKRDESEQETMRTHCLAYFAIIKLALWVVIKMNQLAKGFLIIE